MHSKTCIFCNIAAGEETASKIFEDESMLIIMDAYPLAEGHCMVIPKHHAPRLHQLDEAARSKVFELGYKAMQALQACGYGRAGINVMLNDGKAANQTVPHLHLHIIPRKGGDLLAALPKLALHVTGLFGLKARRHKLDTLARQLSKHF